MVTRTVGLCGQRCVLIVGESWTLDSYCRGTDGGVNVRSTPLVCGRQMTIGRSSRADVPIPDPRLSAAHFSVICRDGADDVVLSDLGSTNGTSVNGFDLRDGALLVEYPVPVCAGRSLFVIRPTDSVSGRTVLDALAQPGPWSVPLTPIGQGTEGEWSASAGRHLELETQAARDRMARSVLFTLLLRSDQWRTTGDVRVFVAAQPMVLPASTATIPAVEILAEDEAAFARLEGVLVDITSRRAGHSGDDGLVLVMVGQVVPTSRLLRAARWTVAAGGQVLWVSAPGDIPVADQRVIATEFGPPITVPTADRIGLGIDKGHDALFRGLATMLQSA